jgi:hypothetical protein
VEARTEAAKSGECLTRHVAGLSGDAARERRHEALMEWAEAELGLERGFAEELYALAEEEQLPPVHALLLVHCGVGVRELEEPPQDADEAAAQASPPGWVEAEQVEFADIALERQLRLTFRRFRARLEEAGSAVSAVESFLAEPDVGSVRLRR